MKNEFELCELNGLKIYWKMEDYENGFLVRMSYEDDFFMKIPQKVNSAHPILNFSYSTEELSKRFEGYFEYSYSTKPVLEVSFNNPFHPKIRLYPDKPEPGPEPHPPIFDPLEKQFLNKIYYHELFPYLFIHPWPYIPENDRQTRFFAYTDTGAESEYKTFSTKLKELKNSGRRSDMENESVNFINGEEMYKNQYIYSLEKTDSVLSELLPTYNSLKKHNFITLEILTIEVMEHFGGWIKLKQNIQKQEYKNDAERLWNSIFALCIELGYKNEHLDNTIKASVIYNLINIATTKLTIDDMDESKSDILPEISNEEINRLINANLLLPADIFPLPPNKEKSENENADDDQQIYFPEPYAIGELQLVKYRLKSYELGEVCHIENVLKGESKEVTERQLRRIHSAESLEQDIKSKEKDEYDLLTTDFATEINKTLQKKITETKYHSAGKDDIGGWTVTKEPAGGLTKNAIRYAKDIVDNAVRQIKGKVNHCRSFNITTESEQIINHCFDNSDGNKNILGIYRWINKVYSLKTINIGRKLVIEFLINDPAEQYIQNEEQYSYLEFESPIPPDKWIEQNMVNSSELKKTLDDGKKKFYPYMKISLNSEDDLYYLNISEKYSIAENIPLPPTNISVSIQIEGITPVAENKCIIPENYIADSAEITVQLNNTKLTPTVLIGSFKADKPENSSNTISGETREKILSDVAEQEIDEKTSANAISYQIKSFNNFTGSDLPVSVIFSETGTDKNPETVSFENNYYALSAKINCKPNDYLINAWKYKVYEIIKKGYLLKRDEYFRQLNSQKKELTSQNSNINLEIEKQQLRYKIIHQLRDVYENLVGPAEKEKDIKIRKMYEPRLFEFLEDLFEWDEMKYCFSPDFGSKENYYIDYTGNDFRNFLRAKSARVLMPVIPGKELVFLYYLNSGMIWSGNEAITPVLSGTESIVNELKNNKKIENYSQKNSKWEVRIPTTMIYLQDSENLPAL